MAFSQCLSKLFRRKKKEEDKPPVVEEKVVEEPKKPSEEQKASTEEQAPGTPPSKSPSSNIRCGSKTSSPRKSVSTPTTGTGSKASAKEACCNICMTSNPPPKESKRSKVSKKKSSLAPKKKSSIGGPKDTKLKKKSSVSSKSERAIRVKKKLSSRPIKDTALKKMAQRVEARRHDSPRKKKLADGDLIFPQRKSNRSGTTNSDDLTQVRQRTHTDMNSSPRAPRKVESNKDQWQLVKNNDNNGKLFVEGKKGKMIPFWIKDDSDETEAAEDTEDDMVLNADAVLDVLNGTLQLAEVPNVEILFDPFQPLKEMQKKDGMFFTPQVLLGNSLRSMINLTEPLQENEHPCPHVTRKKKSVRIKMADPPAKVTTYNRTKWTEQKQRPWKPSGKKIVY